jgi:hypothetical protein
MKAFGERHKRLDKLSIDSSKGCQVELSLRKRGAGITPAVKFKGEAKYADRNP